MKRRIFKQEEGRHTKRYDPTRPRANPRNKHITEPKWVAPFLNELARIGVASAAARNIGQRPETVYAYKANHPELADRWKLALEICADTMEAEARLRAVDGVDQVVEKIVVVDGKIVSRESTVKRGVKSDQLLMFLLRAYRPDVFRNSASVEVSGPDGAPVKAYALLEGSPEIWLQDVAKERLKLK